MTELESRYGGFSAEIYKGEPLPENLVGTWSRLPAPENTLAAYTYTIEARDENGEYALYTVVSSLSDNLPSNSVFQRNYIIYNILYTISYNKAVFLTLALLAASAVLLVYLLWAAGHRAGVEGVVLNWQDRIPLDIYILCASTIFVIVLSMVDRFLHWNQTTFYLPAYLVPLGLSVAAAEVVALASLLTLAARLKRGGWWRNTVCYFLASCCWRLWKRCWNALTDFVRILPLTWRSVLAVGLGNRRITADALGPLAMEKIIVTRHLKDAMPEAFENFARVGAVSPGVLGVTGVETGEIVQGVCRLIKPDAIIAVDALASRRMNRLCRTVQLSDSGITPGGGVGPGRVALDRDSLGAPVIAIGVPMVVDAWTLAMDLCQQAGGSLDSEDCPVPEGAMIVTPKDIDALTRKSAKLIGYAVNMALHGGLSVSEIEELLG